MEHWTFKNSVKFLKKTVLILIFKKKYANFPNIPKMSIIFPIQSYM